MTETISQRIDFLTLSRPLLPSEISWSRGELVYGLLDREGLKNLKADGKWLRPRYRGRAAFGTQTLRIEAQDRYLVLAASGQAIDQTFTLDQARKMISGGWRVTRCDFAVDVETSAWTAATLEKWAREFADATNRTFSMWVDRDGLTTLYIGSRASERMLRIYDKPNIGAVRFELEVKGRRANALAPHNLRHVEAAGALKSFVSGREPIQIINALQYASDGVIGMVGRKDTNTEIWLLKVVVLALARATIENEEFYKRFTDAYEEALDRIRRVS